MAARSLINSERCHEHRGFDTLPLRSLSQPAVTSEVNLQLPTFTSEVILPVVGRKIQKIHKNNSAGV